MLSCALLALQSDGVVGAATCVAHRVAVLSPRIERLKQLAAAHTAGIRRIACCGLRRSVQAFWSREPLAAMQPHFPQKSEADNRQQRFVHSLAAGVQPMFERTDEMRGDAPCGVCRLGASLHRCCAACAATGLNAQVKSGCGGGGGERGPSVSHSQILLPTPGSQLVAYVVRS